MVAPHKKISKVNDIIHAVNADLDFSHLKLLTGPKTKKVFLLYQLYFFL